MHELFQTIVDNDFRRFQNILNNYPYVADEKAEHGVSGILFAIYHGRPEFAHELVKAGATVRIFEAAALGDLKKVEELLQRNPTEVNSFSDDGFQPLGLAAFFGHVRVAEYLLEHGADPKMPSRNGQKVAPIHSAAASRGYRIVEQLIKNGADVNAKQQGGFTALHAAIQNRDLETIRILIENGADCTTKNDRGQIPSDFVDPSDDEEIRRILRSCR